MRDKFIIGVIVGLLADAVKLSFNYLAFRLHFATVVFWQIAASRLLEKNNLHKPIAYIVGGITDLTITSIVGALFVYFLHFTGRDYIWLKGVGLGLTIWVGLLGTLLVQSRVKLDLTSADIIVTAIAHLIYGLSLAFFARKFYRLPTHPI